MFCLKARERCWRIGQNRQVTIYRLLTAGTVEEKIYHRQIFKQYLTNRVLKDPKQRRFFKTNDMHELFTLGSDSNKTESSAIFAGTDSEVKVNPKAKRLKASCDQNPKSCLTPKSQLPPQKVEELRMRAKMISKMIAEKFSNKNNKISQNSNEESPTLDTEESNSKSPENVGPNSEKSRKERKQKHVKSGTKFEGKRIKYLVKQDNYRETLTDKQKNSEDEYILKKLFKKSKVHSALQHDVIECTTSPDFALAEKEAETVAKQAINALKRSRELCLSGQSGVNAWSGLKSISANNMKFGQKRKLNTLSENDPSSRSLMNDIKSRNKFESEAESDSEQNNREVKSFGLNSECEALLADIRNYIAFQSKTNGEATTQELLEAFKSKLPPHQSAVFKSLLYQLCDFYRNSDKVGVWKLKSDFR